MWWRFPCCGWRCSSPARSRATPSGASCSTRARQPQFARPWPSSNRGSIWRAPLAIAASLATLTACQSTGTAVTDTACQAFVPIAWSARDTVETIEAAAAHNRAWDALCAPDSAD